MRIEHYNRTNASDDYNIFCHYTKGLRRIIHGMQHYEDTGVGIRGFRKHGVIIGMTLEMGM